RSARASIFIGGELGTLGEFCSGWMCGANVLGILKGAGGVTDRIEDLLGSIETSWGSQVLYDSNPSALVQSVCDAIGNQGNGMCSSDDEPDADVRRFVNSLIEREQCGK